VELEGSDEARKEGTRRKAGTKELKDGDSPV
jgi:hypothetical protein